MEIVVNNVFLDIDETETIALNYSIDDLSDISSKATDYTKTFTLKGTNKNNQAFGHFFEPSKYIAKELSTIPSESNSFAFFNPQKSIDATMYKDGIHIMDGELKLLKVNVVDSVVFYEVVFFGKLGSLYNELRYPTRYKLSDVVSGSMVYDQNVVEMPQPIGSDVTFPYINYGNNILPDYPFYNCRPAFKVKYLIDNIFAKTKFVYDCPFFNTAFFNRLYIPNNQQILSQKGTGLVEDNTQAANSFSSGIGSSTDKVEYNGSSFHDFTTTNNMEFEYTGSNTIKVNITAKVVAKVDLFISALFKSTAECAIWLNGSVIPNADISFIQDFNGGFFLTANDVTINTNDVIKVEWFTLGSVIGQTDIDIFGGVGFLKIESTEIIDIPISIGDTINYKDVIPQGVYCDDFLTSILKMFNLYVRQRKYTNILDIRTYDEFYSSVDVEDWTNKVDLSNDEITPISEVMAQKIELRYEKDNDYLNDEYSKKYNEGYGDLIHVDGVGESTDEVSVIFSATPTYAETSDELITAGIFKQEKATGVMSATASKIRILQLYECTHSVDKFNLKDNQASDITPSTDVAGAGTIIAAIMWDNPLIPTNGIFFESLGFGSPNELYYNTGTNSTFNIGLFNSFFSNYFGEIMDASSVLLTCNVRLNVMDVHNLDFGKAKIINGVKYRLINISDFDLNNDKLALCTFLKIIE